jgi:hypothetical protein
MGWPVSLACAQSHFISRFDDGQVVHNIESSDTHAAGAFASDPDEAYVKRFDLPKKAIDCGSDLRRLTAREMLGTFVAARARHFQDSGDWERSDVDYSFSRVLFPKYRRTLIFAVVRAMRRGEELFNPDEVGHPKSLFPMIFGPKHHPATYSADLGDWVRPMPFVAEALSHASML